MRRCGFLTVVKPISRFRTFGSFLDHERISKQSMQGAGGPKSLKVSAKGSFPMASPESTNPRLLYTPRALAACEKGSPNNPHKHWSVGYPIVPDWWHDSPLSRWNHPARDEGTHRQHRSGYRSRRKPCNRRSGSLSDSSAESQGSSVRTGKKSGYRSGGNLSLGAQRRWRQGSVGVFLSGWRWSARSTAAKSGRECGIENQRSAHTRRGARR